MGAQAVAPHPVKRIYIDQLGAKNGSADIRRELISELRKSKIFQLAGSPSEADAVLVGDSEIWTKGFYSLNPRAGTSPANGQPVFGGFLSCELKDRNGDTIWSYLVTPAANSKDPARDLSRQVVKHLGTFAVGKSQK